MQPILVCVFLVSWSHVKHESSGDYLRNFCQVTDGMIMAASEALANANTAEDLAEGRIYPGLSDVRSISVR